AREHRGMAREGIGHRRKQRQGRRVGRRERHRDERVAAQQLAVEDPRAVEASGLDLLDQLDQLRHRRRAGDPKRDLNTCHGVGILPISLTGRLSTLYRGAEVPTLPLSTRSRSSKPTWTIGATIAFSWMSCWMRCSVASRRFLSSSVACSRKSPSMSGSLPDPYAPP